MITKQTVRDHFGLGQQRWSTVARIAKFRRLLGPGENPRNLERILKDLYILRNDALGTASMRRSLTANARVISKLRPMRILNSSVMQLAWRGTDLYMTIRLNLLVALLTWMAIKKCYT